MKKAGIILSLILIITIFSGCSDKEKGNIVSISVSSSESDLISSETVQKADKTEETSSPISSNEDSYSPKVSQTSSISSENSSVIITSSNKNNSHTNNSSKVTSSKVTSSKVTSSKVTSSKVTSSKVNSSKVTSSKVTSSKVNSSKVTSSKVTSSKVTSSNRTQSISMYKVNDPKNTRGLSTKRYGVNFGDGKNEEQPEESIANQERFDNYEGVEALAIDRKTTEKIMYLTFDNGYEYKNLTGKILDVLKEKKVNVTFFPTLSYLKKNPKFVKRMLNEGHIIGNHSATHPDFTKISRTEMAKELYLVDEYLQKNYGYKTKYFRFPSGNHSENSLELVTSVGYKSIFWSVAYADWDTSKQKGADHALKTVTAKFHPGAVILLHAVSSDNASALGKIIDSAHKKGYRFATLDEYYKKQ